MITVTNIKHGGSQSQDVYIGRTLSQWKGSVLANKFRIGQDGNREQVIAKYRKSLWEQIKLQGPVYDELMKLVQRERAGEEIVLLCWCKPEPCHGDVVKGAIEWLAKQ